MDCPSVDGGYALFQLLTTGGTLVYCPQASDFAKALGYCGKTRQWTHCLVGLQPSAGSPVRQIHLSSGRSIWGRQDELSPSCSPGWPLPPISNLQWCIKRILQSRAITKLLTAFELKPDHQRYFIRPVSRRRQKPTRPARPMSRPIPLSTRIWRM